jgi:hypothetical protein
MPRLQVHRLTADDEGVAVIPPLWPGSVRVNVSAIGYASKLPPIEVEVSESDAALPVEIRLHSTGEIVTVGLQLPDGSPAVGAFAAVTENPSITIGRPHARADDHGEVKLPRNLTGFVMVRHPDAAFLVRPWPPEEDEPTLRWTLTPAAPPLTIRVRDTAGERFAVGAPVALWVNGVRLSGEALRWLADAIPMVQWDGSWTGNNLPMEPVSIAAWTGRIPAEEPGERARPATRVPYPWPERVEIRTVN